MLFMIFFVKVFSLDRSKLDESKVTIEDEEMMQSRVGY